MKPADPDPAVPVLVMEILTKALKLVHSPGELGEFLTRQLRPLAGAQRVLLVQYQGTAGGPGVRILSVNPTPDPAFAEPPQILGLVEILRPSQQVLLWRPAEDTPAAGLLRQLEFGLSLGIPLNSGVFQMGGLLILGIEGEERLPVVLDVLKTLAPLAALVMRNAFLYLNQERLIAERTRQLEDSNTALRASQERFTSFMDHLPAMAFIKDTDSRIVYLNRFNQEFFGWEDGVGATASDFFSPEAASQTYADDRAILAGGQVARITSERDKNNVEHIFKLVKFPIGEPGGSAMIAGISIDISEQIQAEEEVRKFNASLEQRVVEYTAQLRAAYQELEAFSYSVSHDLRAPLRAIDGFSRILLEDFSAGLEPEGQRFLELVRTNTQQMGRLVDDLLAFSRLSRAPLHKQPIDPAMEVRHALEVLSHEQEGRRVELVIGSLPLCQADPSLIGHVFINLLANALKFTRRRDLARIEIGFMPGALAPGFETSPAVAGIYFIKDNGVGFDMSFADKLFTAFQRLHRFEDYEGTGIGLAIVQRIISRHGGQVWAEAEVDKGATFFFALPKEPVNE